MRPAPDEAPPGAADAAVLVPVYRDAGARLCMVFVRRTEGGVHGGQIAFPGGRREPGDSTLRETALREAAEEIGLSPDSVRVLAALPAIYVPASGFRIAPFLASIEPPPRWRPAEREIADVISVALEEMARPEGQGVEFRTLDGRPEPRRVPFFRVAEHKLWGASYRIVEPLLPRLLAGEWPV